MAIPLCPTAPVQTTDAHIGLRVRYPIQEPMPAPFGRANAHNDPFWNLRPGPQQSHVVKLKN